MPSGQVMGSSVTPCKYGSANDVIGVRVEEVSASTGGALNYGRYADEQCNTLLDAFSLNETDQTARALYRYLAQSAPIAPIAFKTASVLTPSGLLDGLNPTVSSPFYGIEGWTVHFDKG